MWIALINTLTQALMDFFPQYRHTKPVLMGIILLYVIVWVYATRGKKQISDGFQASLLILSIVIVVIIPAVLFILLRLNSAPHKFVHDGVFKTKVQQNSSSKGKIHM
jgi:glucan phosphoethanolaminetransferase (alkaline phosphatase superfamily)